MFLLLVCTARAAKLLFVHFHDNDKFSKSKTETLHSLPELLPHTGVFFSNSRGCSPSVPGLLWHDEETLLEVEVEKPTDTDLQQTFLTTCLDLPVHPVVDPATLSNPPTGGVRLTTLLVSLHKFSRHTAADSKFKQ